MIYGDFNVGNEKLSKFIGYRKNNIKTINDSTSEIKVKALYNYSLINDTYSIKIITSWLSLFYFRYLQMGL